VRRFTEQQYLLVNLPLDNLKELYKNSEKATTGLRIAFSQ
jgi:hypothetical protein